MNADRIAEIRERLATRAPGPWLQDIADLLAEVVRLQAIVDARERQRLEMLATINICQKQIDSLGRIGITRVNKLEAALRNVLACLSSHQIYDKDVKSVIEQALGDDNAQD